MKQKCGIASKEVIHATAELAKVLYNSVHHIHMFKLDPVGSTVRCEVMKLCTGSV